MFSPRGVVVYQNVAQREKNEFGGERIMKDIVGERLAEEMASVCQLKELIKLAGI